MSFYGKASKPKFRAKLIPTGDYECRVVSALERTNEDGDAFIEFEFKIRDDVETNPNEFKGTTLRKKFKQDADGNYKVNKINEFANACGIEDGVEYQLEELAGSCVIVHVAQFTDRATGERKHYIAYLKDSQVGDTSQPLNPDEFSTISEDDIPF